MKFQHLVGGFATAVTAGTFLLGAAPAASAADAAQEEAPLQPVIAEYHGEKINLAESWEGAKVCTELPGGEARCYDSDAEAQADPELPQPKAALAPRSAAVAYASNPGNCANDYWCLFEHANYKGRKLQFFDSGRKNLANWGFRDKTSSIYRRIANYPLNYGGATMVDFRSGLLHDRVRDIGWGKGLVQEYPNLTKLPYPDGGNWNDKMDALDVKRG